MNHEFSCFQRRTLHLPSKVVTASENEIYKVNEGLFIYMELFYAEGEWWVLVEIILHFAGIFTK